MRPTLHRRSDRSFSARVDYPKAADGRRNQRTITFHGSQRDCEKQLTALLASIDLGTAAAPDRLTVADLLTRWLESKQGRVKPSTLASYRHIASAYLLPALGAVPLARLSPVQIEEFYGTLRTTGRRHGAGGLDPTTVGHVHAVLRNALRVAVRWRLLSTNPIDGVEPIGRVRKPRPVLTPQQTDTLLGAAVGHWLYVPILLAAMTGMRRGEILALTWGDVELWREADVERGRVTVRRAKSVAGERVIELPPRAAIELRRHKAAQAEHRLRFGALVADLGLVVARHDGRAYSGNALSWRFKQLLAELGLPQVPFHRLRRGHGTHLLQNRVPVATVSRRLGHASVNQTYADYSDILPRDDEHAAEVIERVLTGVGDLSVQQRGKSA